MTPGAWHCPEGEGLSELDCCFYGKITKYLKRYAQLDRSRDTMTNEWSERML